MEQLTPEDIERRLTRMHLWKLYKKDLLELCPYPTSTYRRMRKARIITYLLNNGMTREKLECHHYGGDEE
jgi:hypothetical protein